MWSQCKGGERVPEWLSLPHHAGGALRSPQPGDHHSTPLRCVAAGSVASEHPSFLQQKPTLWPLAGSLRSEPHDHSRARMAASTPSECRHRLGMLATTARVGFPEPRKLTCVRVRGHAMEQQGRPLWPWEHPEGGRKWPV